MSGLCGLHIIALVAFTSVDGCHSCCHTLHFQGWRFLVLNQRPEPRATGGHAAWIGGPVEMWRCGLTLGWVGSSSLLLQPRLSPPSKNPREKSPRCFFSLFSFAFAARSVLLQVGGIGRGFDIAHSPLKWGFVGNPEWGIAQKM